MEAILFNIGIGILGILTAAYLNALAANKGAFSFKKWIDENLNPIVFSTAGIIIFSTVSELVPGAIEVIQKLSGPQFPVAGSILAWYSFGAFSYESIRKVRKMNERKSSSRESVK